MDQATDCRKRKAPSPRTCHLSAHVYCREFDDGAIILDLRNGCYLGINAKDLPDLKSRIGNWPTSPRFESNVKDLGSASTESLISDLLLRGILTTAEPKTRPASLVSPLTSLTMDGYSIAQKSIPTTHILQFVLSLVQVLLRGRQGRLEPLLNWIRQRRSFLENRSSVTEDRVADLLSSFFRLRIWFYTANNHCLFDSLVLSVFLTRERVPCTFVIAVATKPFLAHSWVQIGECVLNDTVEYVQTFNPILTVE
jgi:hypothetical protein